MKIYKRIQHNDIYCLDAEGHIREMSIGDLFLEYGCGALYAVDIAYIIFMVII